MQYALPIGAFIGILFFFWGISAMMGASGSSVEERMARYAGGQAGQPQEVVKAGEKPKKRRSSGRKDLVDPFATLSGDAADKKFSTKVQRDLARANLKLRVSEYYYIRVGLALGLGLVLGVLRDPLSGVVGAKYDAGSVQMAWRLPSGVITSTTVIPDFGNETLAQGVTQFATESTVVAADQNGYTRGELTGITVDKVGLINGIFSNGRQQLLGQVAIATFTNPGGLMKEGENNFIKTNNSGDAIIRAPGQAEAGSITAGSLEMSNVDLAEQFAEMIVTQRGFQANSRVITTSDEIFRS